jgi:hypothetical protein
MHTVWYPAIAVWYPYGTNSPIVARRAQHSTKARILLVSLFIISFK